MTTLICVILLTLLVVTSPVSAVEVTFPDANMEAVVWCELSNPTGPITDSDMLNLQQLNGAFYGISNIQGLEYGTNLIELYLHYNQISDISAISRLTNLTKLYLPANQISDISAVSGLTNLIHLSLFGNQIETMNLNRADLSSLDSFDIASNPLTSVLLADATLSQTVFNTLMNGGTSFHTGIAELPGVLNLDMSGADFSDISDLSRMATMDDLDNLSLAGSTNLDGSKVIILTNELDSLNWLDVTGLWNSFDATSQNSLNTWDAIEGNTLVVPEGGTFTMIVCGLMSIFCIRRRK